MLDYEYEIKR